MWNLRCAKKKDIINFNKMIPNGRGLTRCINKGRYKWKSMEM